MNPQNKCTYSLVPSKNTNKEWNLKMIAFDGNDLKSHDSFKNEQSDSVEKCLSKSKSVPDMDLENDASIPLVAIKEDMDSVNGSKKNHIEIDLTIVKEEVLDIDELAEYTWQEELNGENGMNVSEEDKTFLMVNEENQLMNDAPLKISLKQKRRRKNKQSLAAKPKHWCSICKCKCESAYALAVHRRKLHQNAARFGCAYCSKVFFHHSNRNRHQMTHVGPLPRHYCHMCDRSFARKYGLEAHIRSVHTGERPYVCQECGMTFTRDGCYRLHRYVHSGERPYSCNVCSSTFSSKSDLTRHLRIHTGEKPYSCDRCRRTFRLKGQLNRHVMSHTGERPLACGLCPKMFRTGTNVALHRGSHIVNSAVLKIHKCEVCHREFSRRGNLMAHMQRHTAKKCFKCSHCGLAFNSKADMAKHENIHTREKIFLCDTCGKSFLRKGRLREHIRIQHLLPQVPKKPTICLACGKEYYFPSKLKIHQKGKKCRERLKGIKKEALKTMTESGIETSAAMEAATRWKTREEFTQYMNYPFT